MKVNLKLVATLALLLFLVVAVAGCLGSSVPSSSSGNSGNHASIPQVPTQSPVVTGVVGDIMESTFYDGHISWSVSQVIRGSTANSIVESGNMFNQKPNPGYEYCLYQIQIMNLGSSKFSVMPLYWSLYANGVEASEIVIAVLPGSYPTLNYGDIMPGASTSGWIVKQVPSGANLRVYFEPLLGLSSQSCYIQL